MSKAYIFDVFETIVVRKVGRPHHTHFLTGIRVQDDFDMEPELFANARREVENNLKKETGCTPDLVSIYDKLKDILEISDRTAKKIMEVELQIELQNILPVEYNIALLRKLRNDGHRIIYISDTCLSSKFVKIILTQLGIYREGEKIYTSSDLTAKNGEEIISFVTNDHGLNKDVLHYVGENKKLSGISDDINGVEEYSFRNTGLNRFEEYLTEIGNSYKLSAGTVLKYSKLAGASRYVRLKKENENRVIYDVAASVAAPILINFVSGLLNKACGERIYFIARDGYIMHRIAGKIKEMNKLDVELRYLYLSREVMILANINGMSYNKFVQYLQKIYAYEKLSYLLKLFSIEPNELPYFNLENVDPNQTISSLEPDFISRLFHDPAVKEKVYREMEHRKKKLVAYLEQEGLLEDGPVTIVDSGWYLTIHNLLARYMIDNGKQPPEGFYFGINEPANSSIRNGKKYGYFWDLRKGESAQKYKGMALLLETFCSAPHGRTLDYSLTENGAEPVLDQHEIEYLSEWGVHDLTNGILSSVETALHENDSISPNKIAPDIFSGLLKKFWLQPSYDEVKIWGKYPFVLSRDGERMITLHNNKTFLKIFSQIVTKGKLPNGKLDFWPYAHIYSLKKFKSSTLRFSLKLKRRLHYLKRSYTS